MLRKQIAGFSHCITLYIAHMYNYIQKLFFFSSGSYSLVESDGTKRVVQYEADKHNGFNAIVHKIGTPKPEAHGAQYAKEFSHGESFEGLGGHNFEEQGGHFGY